MTGKLLIKGILVWLTSISWGLLLSLEGGSFKPIVILLFLTIALTYICTKTVSYIEFKKVSGYSWLCQKLHIPEDGE